MKRLDITLVDRKKDLTRSWERAFSDLPVTIITGNIFDLHADAIVSPANSFGFMDGGLDGKLRDFFGMHIEEKVRSRINNKHNGELLVGQAIVTETNNDRFPYLITAPTMRVPADVSNSINAYLSMCAIIRVALDSDRIKSIVSSGLCSLSGRMPPHIVARQMSAAYEKVVLNRYLYPHWRHERDFEEYLKGNSNYTPDPHEA